MDISLIILNYNLSQFVSRAIRSCLAQIIFRKNIEIIVVDDNSTDDSLKIINEFNNDITLIKNTSNKGVGYSSNQALKKSKGKFWMRVDADDFITATLLPVQRFKKASASQVWSDSRKMI